MTEPCLREVLHQWDQVTDEWRLDEVERSMVLGAFAGGGIADVETYETAAGETRMRLAVALAPVLRRVHRSPRRTRAWLRSSNANLGGRTPLETMASSPEWIRWLIQNAGVGS